MRKKSSHSVALWSKNPSSDYVYMAALPQSPMLKSLANLDVKLYQKGVLGMRGGQHYNEILCLACHSSFPQTLPWWVYVSTYTWNKMRPSSISCHLAIANSPKGKFRIS